MVSSNSNGVPSIWYVAFLRRADRRWLNWFVPGRFKHVRAFGYVPDCDCWVFYDVGFQTTLALGRGGGAAAIIKAWTGNAEVLKLAPRKADRIRIIPFSCTSAIANLLGLPLWCVAPEMLYRACLRHGAQRWAVVHPKSPR